jgi:hypothetical protein
MPKKVLVVYYTQTGQLRNIVQSVTRPLAMHPGIKVILEELKPKPAFPFPWTSDEFFQTMPESVKGIPCMLEPLSAAAGDDFDMVIVAWQPWYLSPSIPIHAFFQSEEAKKILRGKPVVTVIGCRNMWVMAQERVKRYIAEAGGHLAGNIVMFDRAPNLLSVLSVIRWMFYNKKNSFGIIPQAGVSETDIRDAQRFGEIVREHLLAEAHPDLCSNLVSAGAVNVKPGLVMIEKRGILLFRLWANFVLQKGTYGQAERRARIRLFKYYLLFVIYIVSPPASLLFCLTRPFRLKTLKKQISLYQSS